MLKYEEKFLSVKLSNEFSSFMKIYSWKQLSTREKFKRFIILDNTLSDISYFCLYIYF